MIWKHLGKAHLQKLIDPALLERLEHLLPILSSGEMGDTHIYSRTNLTRIFNSFVGSNFLSKQENREMILNSVPEDKLNELCTTIDIDISSSFADKLNAIVDYGWSDSDFCRSFLAWGELSESLLPFVTTSVPHEEIIEGLLPPYKVLKDYQFDVFEQAKVQLAPSLSRFVIQMPTGSGKTRTAMELITDFIRSDTGSNVIVWVAHSEEICEQSLQCFKEIWLHIGTKPLRVFRCWGTIGDLPYTFEGSAFIVASFQKLHSLLKKKSVAFDELRNRIGLIIIDEAHKVIAPTYKIAIKALLGEETRIFGLTATPGRGCDAIEANKELSEFFFRQIISIAFPDGESAISYLRKKEVLARVKAEPLVSGRTYELSKREIHYLEERFQFPPGFLSRVAGDDLRNVEIVKRLDQECSRGAQILFFACSVEHSRFISSMIQYLGYNAVHIDGSTDKNLRRHSLQAFRSGDVQVICNYGILSTGFDAPRTDVVFISRPTASIVLYSQMVGRGLRGPAIGGTKSCKLIDVRDNILGFSDSEYVYTYFDNYWLDS